MKGWRWHVAMGLRGSAMAVLLGGAAAMAAGQPLPATTGPTASAPQTFADAAAAASWRFSNGPEWPGAVGSLEHRADAGRRGAGDGVLVLAWDFTGGGNYVAAMTPLPPGIPAVRAVRLWVHKPAANLMIFRAVDADGETFQKNLAFDYRGWQQLEIALDGWVHRWGGDGKFAWPARQFDILIENQGGAREGELLIDDVQWIYEPEPAADGVRRATYVETTFESGWKVPRGSDGTFERGVWSYELPGRVKGAGQPPRCRLAYGRSLLGRPAALKLTVESDRAGDELTAVIASHFQNFERSLGRVTEGTQTFEVPLGDMSTWRHYGGEDDGIVRYPLRLEELVLTDPRWHSASGRDFAPSTGTLRLVRLEVVTDYDAGRPVTLVPHVVDEDEPVFFVELRSLHDQPLAGELRCRVRSFDQTVHRETVPVTIPALGRVTVERSSRTSKPTMIEGEFEFVGERCTAGPVSITIAQPPAPGSGQAPAPPRPGSGQAPARPPAGREPPPTGQEPPTAKQELGRYQLDPESRIGAGLYLYRFNGEPDAAQWMERMAAVAAAAGIKWTREEFQWHKIEPRKGEFDFAFFDQLVDTALRHGISIYGLCCYYTDWNKPPVTDEFIANYCNYLRVLVGRYKDRIRHWEIWNEPNIFFWPGPKDRYPVLLKRAYETIKEVDPEAQVLGCSTAGIDTEFVKMVMAAGAPFDALTVHPYRHELDPAGFIRELRGAKELAGGRDVWITEMGWSSELGGKSEREQASYVARTYITALASGAVRTVAWYDFREDGRDPFYNEHHFGLVREDLIPKIGYRALAAVGQLLGGTEAAGEVPAGELLGYAFKPVRPGAKHVAALWSPERGRLAHLEIQPPGAEVRNAMNEPAACVRDDAGVTLQMQPDLPVYLVADEPIRVKLLPPPIEVDAVPATVHPGEVVTLRWRGKPGVQVGTPVLPGGWTTAGATADTATGSANRTTGAAPPPWAPPGTYELTVPVTIGTTSFELPVKVAVVPALLRG